ncbi:MAG TPA: cysteine desulfurase CsdA [Bdellovibrionales bacterium]|nr:cysteine desulfurase CsdA [Pseudobdellovibrionaceae bacterium]HAG90897.1 cysteine desulfurase CsdA [Bdellovibrionales bacterium]|tara:strand:- start:1066 stop:2280 length:1215 start_codon:yes stop_codon:yes gene_type:complete
MATKLNSTSQIQKHFPQYGNGSVYLDSAATTLKAQSVIDRMTHWMTSEVSNVHRGGHKLGNAATNVFEQARVKVADFLGANSSNEIVFTRGTTESINLLACTLFESERLTPGDEIILSQLEHHSNIVPWQIWAERKGLKVHFIRLNKQGELDFEHFESLIHSRSKVLSLTQQSNALGVQVDVQKFVQLAKSKGLLTVVDGAQSVSSHPVNVQEMDCDFFVFSGHKLFGPTGIGVLYGREDLLNELPPYQGGGSMIDRVSEEGATFLKSPQRFEAGTPAIAEAICLGEAIDFVNQLDWEFVAQQDHSLVKRASDEIEALGFKVFAKDLVRNHVVSFVHDGVHPSDVASLLSEMDVAVRSGHHCCQPLMAALGVGGTLRASFSIYSDENDLDRLVEALKKAKGMLL